MIQRPSPTLKPDEEITVYCQPDGVKWADRIPVATIRFNKNLNRASVFTVTELGHLVDK